MERRRLKAEAEVRQPAEEGGNQKSKIHASKRAVAGRSAGTNRGQLAFGRKGQRNKFMCDAENQFYPVSDHEFAVQAFAVRVDGVRREVEITGDGKFRVIVKNPLDDLKFTP